MTRAVIAGVVLMLSTWPALADGWSYSSSATPLLPKGEKLQVLSRGAASFLCSAPHFPLTFSVEISYDISQVNKTFPPKRVAWIVDQTMGPTSMWKHQGLYVVADASTSKKVAAAARHAKAYVGISTGKLTSLFDVNGLAAGLARLEKACG